MKLNQLPLQDQPTALLLGEYLAGKLEN